MSNNQNASLAAEEYGLTFSNGMLFSLLAGLVGTIGRDSYKFCGDF